MRSTPCWTKRELYQNVDEQLAKLNVNRNSWVDATLLAYEHCHNMDMRILKLGKGLCAIMHKGPHGTTLALNQERNGLMQNFDCMHELIHYFFHSQQKVFYCFENNKFIQNPIQEWQANEGAAQALTPYQTFIPDYVEASRKYARVPFNEDYVKDFLADKYQITPVVAGYRIKSLSYEISQYMNGIPIEHIEVLSYREVQRRGLVKYCNHERSYCLNCLSEVNGKSNFCHMCGVRLVCNEYEITQWVGDGFMKYPSYDLDRDGKAVLCPVCKNEEIEVGKSYCKICGKFLINQCAGKTEWSNYHQEYIETVKPCGSIASGNARFCSTCGCPTTYLNQELLVPWEKEKVISPKPPTVLPLPPITGPVKLTSNKQ